MRPCSGGTRMIPCSSQAIRSGSHRPKSRGASSPGQVLGGGSLARRLLALQVYETHPVAVRVAPWASPPAPVASVTTLKRPTSSRSPCRGPIQPGSTLRDATSRASGRCRSARGACLFRIPLFPPSARKRAWASKLTARGRGKARRPAWARPSATRRRPARASRAHRSHRAGRAPSDTGSRIDPASGTVRVWLECVAFLLREAEAHQRLVGRRPGRRGGPPGTSPDPGRRGLRPIAPSSSVS
jgi:hypothetical protein